MRAPVAADHRNRLRKRVVWLVVDAYLNLVEDEAEWIGTGITFDVVRKGDRTEVRFNHVGLADHECFEVCSNAWAFTSMTVCGV